MNDGKRGRFLCSRPLRIAEPFDTSDWRWAIVEVACTPVIPSKGTRAIYWDCQPANVLVSDEGENTQNTQSVPCRDPVWTPLFYIFSYGTYVNRQLVDPRSGPSYPCVDCGNRTRIPKRSPVYRVYEVYKASISEWSFTNPLETVRPKQKQAVEDPLWNLAKYWDLPNWPVCCRIPEYFNLSITSVSS